MSKLDLCSQGGMGPERHHMTLAPDPDLGKMYGFYIRKFIWVKLGTERETALETVPFLD